MNLRSLVALLALGGCSALQHLSGDAPLGPQWVSLFNGKNLDGWNIGYAAKPQDDRPPSVMFEVKDGVIHTYPNETDGTTQPNAYLQTKVDYGDFVVHVEYKWGQKRFAPRLGQVRDAGLVYLNYENPVNNWPHGVECQFEEGDTGDTWAISSQASSTIKPDTQQYAPPADGGLPVTVGKYLDFVRIRHGSMNEKDGWNTVEVVVRGDTATHIVNGVVNMRVHDLKKWDAATGTWVRLDHGKFLIQAEDSEVYYRNIRVRALTSSDP